MDIEKVKKVLKDKKMTYEKLSEVSGIPIGTIKRLLSGVTVNPRIDTVSKIEEVLGLRSSELVQPYLTTQEEELLQRFRSLSKKGRTSALEIISVLDRYEN